MRTLLFIFLFSLNTQADILSEIFNSYGAEESGEELCVCPEPSYEGSEAGGGEHYSWELGVPDNMVETEVIILD
jgi:hypothetical protein